MAVDESEERPSENFLEMLLDSIRKQYVERHGEEPPDEFMQEARNELVHGLARKDREEHREIYDALADE